MLRAVLAIAGKDIITWLRTPTAIAVSLLPPIAFVLIIFVSAGAVGHNPVALVMEGQGPQAERLKGILESSDAFRIREASASEAQTLLDTVQVSAVITIPATFDANLSARRPDPVLIRVNNLNLDFTNDLRRSLPAAITRFYASQADTPVGVTVRESDLRPTDVSLIQFDLVPNLILLITVAGVINCGLATAREFEDLTIKALLLAPISRGTLIAGKLLAGWLITMAVAAVVLAISAVFGFIRPAGWYWAPAVGVIALFAVATSGIGAAIGAAVRRFSAVTGIGINLAVYLFFLSGGISVAAFLPGWVQGIAHFTPTYYGVDALEKAIFYQSTDNLGLDLAVLAATAVLGLLVGVLSLRRRVVS